MTRRAFSLALAGLAAGPFTSEARHDGLFEWRSYRTFSPASARQLAGRLTELFPRAGIRPSMQGINGADLTYLIQFEDLAARNRAWTVLTTDPGWTGTQFRSYHFGLYHWGLNRSA